MQVGISNNTLSISTQAITGNRVAASDERDVADVRVNKIDAADPSGVDFEQRARARREEFNRDRIAAFDSERDDAVARRVDLDGMAKQAEQSRRAEKAEIGQRESGHDEPRSRLSEDTERVIDEVAATISSRPTSNVDVGRATESYREAQGRSSVSRHSFDLDRVATAA